MRRRSGWSTSWIFFTLILMTVLMVFALRNLSAPTRPAPEKLVVPASSAP